MEFWLSRDRLKCRNQKKGIPRGRKRGAEWRGNRFNKRTQRREVNVFERGYTV